MSAANWLEVLGWSEEDLEDLRFVGYSYLKQGKYDIASTFFEALVILAPTSPYDLQTLGALYLQRGDHQMALTTIDKALKMAPQHGPTLLNRAKVLFALGYKKQALTQAKALQSHSDPQIASLASALIEGHLPG